MTREPKLILNLTRENVVCDRAVVADTPLRRMRGLLGRRSLLIGEGLLLQPAPSIHTALMRFPIDAVFLDRNLRVLRLAEAVRPWRAAFARHARSVLELPAGAAKDRGVEVGDQLIVVDSDPDPSMRNVIARGTGEAAGTAPRGAANADVHIETEAAAAAGRPISSVGQPTSDGAAIRVLVVSSDRRFRAVTGALLTRRGCDVVLGDRMVKAGDLARAEHVEVAVLDAGGSLTTAALATAELETLRPAVGIVVVGDEARDGLEALPVVTKWGSFAGLYGAIERARPVRSWRPSHASRF